MKFIGQNKDLTYHEIKNKSIRKKDLN